MTRGRLEAFSDGVLAIIITIMVLELHAPHAADVENLKPLWPGLLSYVLSFIYVGIYWNNHHHLFHAVQRVTGMTLWANLHLLFWLSLLPASTSWMGQTHFAPQPVFAYGLNLLMCAIAWTLLCMVLVHHHGRESVLAKAIYRDPKQIASLLLYATALALAFAQPVVSSVLYLVVAALWFVPDRRIERILNAREK
ncbi:MAG TPA: TMEM175 family protein [Phycisphaerales bacterium]|nr:TMEM175 family protein [Phycisphaerales bacterium]